MLELIRFCFFVLPYLSDFAWIIRSKNFRFNNFPSSSTGSVPVVLRVQRYCFFLSVKHFFKIFSIYFELFHYSLTYSTLQEPFRRAFRQITPVCAMKTPLFGEKRLLKREKISQILRISRKTGAFLHGSTTLEWRLGRRFADIGGLGIEEWRLSQEQAMVLHLIN